MKAIFACNTCIDQIENPDNVDLNHWRCLNDSMWNENVPVQVVAWRMLKPFARCRMATGIIRHDVFRRRYSGMGQRHR